MLLIDLDPQGNASTGLGLTRDARTTGTYALLTKDKSIAEVIQPTSIVQLSIVAADSDLIGAEIELVNEQRREYRLRDALHDADTRLHYDYVLIDCPPSLSLLTLNGLVAADAVLVPLQCEYFPLEGISQTMRTIDLVRRRLNPDLRLQGIVLTMFDKRNNLSEQVATDARGYFGNHVYDTVIPRNIRVSEAPSHGKPVILYDIRSPGAQAYVRLAAELLRRDRRQGSPT